jgi:hypothetical protein
MGMLTKLNVVTPFAVVAFGLTIASSEPALAGLAGVPAPIIGAGLPVLAVLGAGYWLVRRFCRPR